MENLNKIFNIPEILIINEIDRNNVTINIFCITDNRIKPICPHCNTNSNLAGYDSVKTKKNHSVLDGKKVVLFITKRRMLCKTCNKVFTEKIDGMKGKGSSDHFVQLVQEKARNRNLTSVSKEMGIACTSVSNMLNKLDLDKVNLPKKKRFVLV